MHILDFPLELIQRILYHMAFSRGVTRALRLRLVCKLFRDSLRSALFETRLLDDFDPGQGHYCNRWTKSRMENWFVRNQHCAEEFWHSYITYRVRNVKNPKVGRLVEIRDLAKVYCQKTGSTDLHGTIDTLCWMALERAARCPAHVRFYMYNCRPWDDTDRDPGLNLLSAAAYLGNLPLAKQLLEEGQCPVNNNELFDSPMRLAAWSGHSDILQLFQEHLPEYECSSTEAGIKLRAKADPGSITGAAINGDLNMLRLAIYPPSRAEPDNSDFGGFPYGHAVIEDPFDERVCELYKAVYMTRSVEAFKYICSFFEHGKHKEFMVDNVVRCHCEWGNLDIVKHLVKTYGLGTIDLYGAYNSKSNCLVGAARGWHEDILDYLLESGMHPARFAGDVPPLYAATYAGSMSIVRKLIKHGANPCEGVYENLHNAVRLEHTTLLEFLLERNGYRDEPSALRRALKDAIDLGLESMVEILQRKNLELGTQDDIRKA